MPSESEYRLCGATEPEDRRGFARDNLRFGSQLPWLPATGTVLCA